MRTSPGVSAAIILVAVLAAGRAGAQEAAPDAEYAAALGLAARKEHVGAAAALEKVLARLPTHPRAGEARVRLGDSLLALGKPEQSAKQYETALAGKPEGALRIEALLGLGRSRLAAKAEAAAIQPLTEAFNLSEYDETWGPVSGLLLGDALTSLERYQEAAKAFERTTRWPLHPDAPRAYVRAGDSYRLAGSLPDAAAAYRATAEKYPRLPLAAGAALAAADAFLALKQHGEAEVEFRRVLQQHAESPEAPRAQLGLGRIAFAEGRYSIARAAFQGVALAFASSPVAAEAELRIADTYRAEKNADEAAKRYGTLSASPNRAVAAEAQYAFASVAREQGRLEQAAESFRKLAALTDSGRWGQLAGLRVAETALGSGDLEGAAEALHRVLSRPGEPALRDEATLALAEVFLRRRDFPAADAGLLLLLQRSPAGPNSALARARLSRSRLEQGDIPAALQYAEAGRAPGAPPEARAEALLTIGLARLRHEKGNEASVRGGVAALREVLGTYAGGPAAPEAARALLTYYRDAGQTGPAEEIEKLIAQRYPTVGAAFVAQLSAGEEHLQAGRWVEAARLFSQVLAAGADRPSRLRTLAGLAEARAAMKQPSGPALEEIARDAPPDGFLAASHLRAGRAAVRAGDSAAAGTAFRAALAAGPAAESAAGALIGLADLAIDAGRPREALDPIRQLVDRYPRSAPAPRALYALGWALTDLQEPDAARAAWERLVQEYPMDPLAPDASFRLGERLEAAGDYTAAGQRYRAAVGSAHLAAQAGYRLGWALRRTGDHAGAARAFAAAARVAGFALATECRVRAGESLLSLEQDEAALYEFETALKELSGKPGGAELEVQAKSGAAQAHRTLGHLEQARALAGEVALPANGWYGAKACLVRAETAFLKDGPRAAAPEFARAAALFSRYPEIASEALFRAGECQQKIDPAAAGAVWRRIEDLYPETTWAAKARDRIKTEARRR